MPRCHNIRCSITTIGIARESSYILHRVKCHDSCAYILRGGELQKVYRRNRQERWKNPEASEVREKWELNQGEIRGCIILHHSLLTKYNRFHKRSVSNPMRRTLYSGDALFEMNVKLINELGHLPYHVVARTIAIGIVLETETEQ